MRREWKAKVKAKFEECEVQKRVLLANMKREHRMVVVKREFILALMRMDFVEEEIEDIYGAGRVGICEGE